MANPTNKPNLSRTGTVDESKNYKDVRFQQGSPVLDVDLNDAQDLAANQTKHVAQMAVRGDQTPQTVLGNRQWTVVPVSRAIGGSGIEGEVDANNCNFAVTMGSLLTPLGVLDNSNEIDTANLESQIIFDWHRIVDLGAAGATMRPWANHMFHGKVTAAGAGLIDEMFDENKMFTASHNLLGTSTEAGGYREVVVSGPTGPVHDEPLPAGTATPAAFQFRVEESACRIYFVTGANAGEVRDITGYTATSVQWLTNLPAALAQGDEYYIIPGNDLVNWKAQFDAMTGAQAADQTYAGLVRYPMMYVQVFNEDISSDEDEDLLDVTLGMETTHRTQVRYCVRMCLSKWSMTTDMPGLSPITEWHLARLLDDMNKEPHYHSVGNSLIVDYAVDPIEALRHTATQVPAIDPDGSGTAVSQWFDQGPGNFGATPSFAMKISEGFGTGDVEFSSDRWWTAAHCLLQETCGGAESHIVPLAWIMPPWKRMDPTSTDLHDDDVLSPYFIPGLLHPLWDDGGGIMSIPMVGMYGRENNIVTNGGMNPGDTGLLFMGGMMQPPKIVMGVAEMSRSLVNATAVVGMTTAEKAGGGAPIARGITALYDRHGNIPLQYQSLGCGISSLTNWYLNQSGLGHQMGMSAQWAFGQQRDNSGNLIEDTAYGLPSSNQYVANGDTTALFASGQSAEVFAYTPDNTSLNPTDKSVGTVCSIDPLVGGVSQDAGTGVVTIEDGVRSGHWWSGEFIPGYGKYITRGGDEITVDSEQGWGFYNFAAQDYAKATGSSTEPDFTQRGTADGQRQAELMRQALMFRKLAIKTQGHVQMDMFNYHVAAPWRVMYYDTTEADSLPRTWKQSQDGAGDVSGNSYDGFIMASAAAFLDTSMVSGQDISQPYGHPEEDEHGNSPVNLQSYGVGAGVLSDGTVATPASLSNFPPGEGDADETPGEGLEANDLIRWGHHAINVADVSNPADVNQDVIEADVRMDMEAGPWGRFPTLPTDEVNPLDTWENRCTVARLRYHIGDYYPGPETLDADGAPTGTKTNALVDTLNLFVRFEPLSLTHWATLPKHQHNVLQGRMSMLDGLLSFIERVNLEWITENLIDEDGLPKIIATSPDLGQPGGNSGENAAFGTMDPNVALEIGDRDWRDTPIPDAFQPFVHWYHPFMESIRFPHGDWDENASLFGGADSYPQFDGVAYPVYNRWGERSLIIPTITTQPTDQFLGEQSSTQGLKSVNDLDYWGLDDFASSNELGTTQLWSQIPRLGNHNTNPGTASTTYSGTVNVDGATITVPNNLAAFPFVPDGVTSQLAYPGFSVYGKPGPTFMPAFKWYLKGENSGDIYYDDSGYYSENTGGDMWDLHPVFRTHPSSSEGEDLFKGFPLIDKIVEIQNNWYSAAEATGPYYTGVGFGQGTQGYNRGYIGFPDDNQLFARSAYDWQAPVMRAKIGTTTLAAICDAMEAADVLKLTWDATSPWSVSDDDDSEFNGDMLDGPGNAIPGQGPDFDVDTQFIGDTGTGIVLDSSYDGARTFYANPLTFSMGSFDWKTGTNLPNGFDTVPSTLEDGDPRNTCHDAFQLMEHEVQAAWNGTADVEWQPLMNTYTALFNAGLAQKLLWNCSFRVLHARPGGGYSPSYQGGGHPNTRRSSAPKSLTELFLVRDRQNGSAVQWPTAPDTMEDKPFLHFQSIHPAAGGGGGPFNAHPNHAYTGHLYPMISDNLGGYVEGVPASSGYLYDTDPMTETDVSAAEFANNEFANAPHGDCYVADPFDFASATYQDTQHGVGDGALVKVAQTDRLQNNCGIEIDLVSELRYVRENAAAHGLDEEGDIGTLMDQMPTVEELTAPGDHEILFVLYTGRYGQRMINGTVPNNVNPPFSGCHINATVEVNRPNEKRPSYGEDATGEHHGEALETFHILGHQ